MLKYDKLTSAGVTLLVIGMLVFVGPVDALFLKLDGFKNTPYDYGEIVNFIGRIDIKSNERVDLQSVGLEVNGKVICTFDVDGNEISGCSGVNVSLISKTTGFGYGYGYDNFNVGWNGSNSSSKAGNYNGYGYGYGYGYSGSNGIGELVYNISVQTPQDYFKISGNNDLKLVANTDKQTFNSRTEKIVLKPQNSGSGGSGRGSGGSSGRGNEEGGRNRNNNNSFDNLSGDKDNNATNFNEDLLSDLKNIFTRDEQSSDAEENSGLITGAVTGKFGKKGYVGIVLFLAVLVIAGFISYRRKRHFDYYSNYY